MKRQLLSEPANRVCNKRKHIKCSYRREKLMNKKKRSIEVLQVEQQIVNIDNDILRLKRENNVSTDELEKSIQA